MSEFVKTDPGIRSAEKKKAAQLAPPLTASIVGAERLLHFGLCELLAKRNINVVALPDSDEPSATAVDDLDCIILVMRGGSYSSLHDVQQQMADLDGTPLVILSEHISRGQVYAALRIGAKGYLDLDCHPDELARAIRMATQGKVQLAAEVAALLVNDVSKAIEPDGSAGLPSLDLSKRETEIVQYLCEGLSSKEVARHLHLSAKTVENHRYNIYRKCEVSSIAGLMRYAIQHGMISI
jgi:DNA-binding NarL/FixJ family response regulator